MSKQSDRRKVLKKYRKENGICVYCGEKEILDDKHGCKDCLNKKYQAQLNYTKTNSERIKLYRQKIKLDVIQKYGGSCKCCGENRLPFLVIDHKNNDGNIERKSTGDNRGWYFTLKNEPIRADLQVLCWNCNNAKHLNGGICPHQTGVYLPDFSLLEHDGRRNKSFNLGEKIEWPEDEQLLKMVNESSCSEVARRLKVHDSAVRGRLKRRQLYNKVILHTGKNKNEQKTKER